MLIQCFDDGYAIFMSFTTVTPKGNIKMLMLFDIYYGNILCHGLAHDVYTMSLDNYHDDTMFWTLS